MKEIKRLTCGYCKKVIKEGIKKCPYCKKEFNYWKNKISIKEFLKPNLGKILIFIAIFFMDCLWGLAGIFVFNCAQSTKFICLFWEYTLKFFNLPSLIIGKIFPVLRGEFYNPWIVSIAFICIFIFWYLLSCFIIHLYKKMRKK